MPRPRKPRFIGSAPDVTMFKPQGIPLSELRGVVLPLEGLEALRLVDAAGVDRAEAAERMGVSQPTLCRILAEARRVVATAISEGWAIRVEGGSFALRSPDEDISQEAFPNRRECRRHGRRCDPEQEAGQTGKEDEMPNNMNDQSGGQGQGRRCGRGGGQGRGMGQCVNNSNGQQAVDAQAGQDQSSQPMQPGNRRGGGRGQCRRDGSCGRS